MTRIKATKVIKVTKAIKLPVLFTSICMWIFLMAVTAFAVPGLNIPHEEIQPSGETFQAQLQGDERFNYTVTETGDLVVKGPDGYWYYGEPDSNGLGKSSAKYQIDKRPLNAQTAKDIPALRAKRLNNFKNMPGTSEQAVLPEQVLAEGQQTQDMLILLVEFANVPINYSDSLWSGSCFGTNGKTVRNYYEEVSNGAFYFAPAAETLGTVNDGIVKVKLNYNHPNNAGDIDYRNKQIVRDALTAANPYVNFGSYDTNGNGYIDYNELHIVTVIAGYEAAYDSSTPSVWAHRWSLDSITLKPLNLVAAPRLDGVYISQSSYGGYIQMGERHGDHLAAIGTLCHELGHDVGLPDLYDYDYDSEGVGRHSLMAAGSWCYVSGEYYGSTPTHLDAWSKTRLGFVSPTAAESGSFNVNSFNNGYNVLKIATSNPKQYFLVENRQFNGFDAGLQTYGLYDSNSGIAIWHIDESLIPASGGAVNNDENHKGVDLEEANYAIYSGSQLDDRNSKKMDYDNYYCSGVNTSFNSATTPNSKLYNGTDTYISISIPGDSSGTMSVLVETAGSGGTVKPTVSISPWSGTVNEVSSEYNIFEITRSTEDVSSDLTVLYSLGGTATYGIDYQLDLQSPPEPLAVTIPAGDTSVYLMLSPLDDTLAEPNETVIVTLDPSQDYNIGTASAVITIIDNDTDTAKPAVSSTDPVQNSTNVPLNKTITVTYNETVVQGVNWSNITLKCGKSTVAAGITLDESSNSIIVDPSQDLTRSKKYTLTVPAGAVKDAAGNPNDKFTLVFTTARS